MTFSTVVLEPTLQCNLACPMCDREVTLRRIPSLMRTSIHDLVAAIPSSAMHAYISGGEPTLYPHIRELCSVLLARGLDVAVQTNGTHPERVRALLDAGVRRFNVSVDGPLQTHDALRGEGAFAAACASMREVRAAHADLVITTVLCAETLGQVAGIFAALRRERVRASFHIFELARRYDALTRAESARLANLALADVAVREETFATHPFSTDALRAVVDAVRSRARAYRCRVGFLPEDLPEAAATHLARARRELGPLRCTHENVLRLDARGHVVPCFTFRPSLGDLVTDGADVIGARAEAFWERMRATNLTPACETCFRAVGR